MNPARFTTRALLFVVAALPALGARGQVFAEWLSPVSGNWDDPANWSTVAVPNNGGGTTYDVLIAAGGASDYIVDIRFDTITVDALTLDDPFATLRMEGRPFFVDTLDVMAGRLVTEGAGVVDAQIRATGAAGPIQWTVVRTETFLENVQVSSSIDFVASDVGDLGNLTFLGTLTLDDGVVLTADTGRLLGRTELYRGASIFTDGQATLRNFAVIETTGSGAFPTSQIGPGIVLEMDGLGGVVDGEIDFMGTIRAIATPDTGNPAILRGDVNKGYVFTNFGLVEALSGSTITLGGNVVNEGVLRADSTSTIRVAGGANDQVVTLGAASQLDIAGTLLLQSGRLDLGGNTLDLDQIGTFEIAGGRLANGTLAGMSAPLELNPPSDLDGVTLDVDVQLGGNRLGVYGGLTLLNGAVVENTSGGFRMVFHEAQSVDGGGVLRFNDTPFLNQIETRQDTGVVVFESGIIIDALNGSGQIGEGDWINRGTIAVGTGHTMAFYGNWSNEGTIVLEAGSVLEIYGSFATADIGAVNDMGGQALILGELDNVGQVLDLQTLSGNAQFGNNAVIRGGTVQSSGPATLVTGQSMTLDRVILDVDAGVVSDLDVIESLTINQTLTVDEHGSVIVSDGDADGIAHLGGVGMIRFVPFDPPSVFSVRVDLTPDTPGTRLEIGAGLTVVQDDPDVELLVGRLGPVANHGTFDLSSGVTTFTSGWSNPGTIRVSGDAEVFFLGEYTTGDLLQVDYQSGSVAIGGALDNTAGVLRKDAAQPWLTVDSEGLSVAGGRVETGDGLSFRNIQDLDGVGLAGEIWLIANSNSIVSGGLILDGGRLHILDNHTTLTSGNIQGTGTVQFDTVGFFRAPVLGFGHALTVDAGVTLQTGSRGGLVGGGSAVWTSHGALRSENNGLDLRLAGAVTHHGSARAANGGSITFDALTNHGSVLADEGGVVRLRPGWSNPTGTLGAEDGGALVFEAWSASPGSIDLDNGIIRLAFDTDLALLNALPQDLGSTVVTAADLDLGGGTLDLNALVTTFHLDGGTLRNGSVFGTMPLQVTNANGSASTLDALQVFSNVQVGDTGTTRLSGGTTFFGSTIAGEGTLRLQGTQSAAFNAATFQSTLLIDADATLDIDNGLMLDGTIASGGGAGDRPSVRFNNAQVVFGVGTFEAVTGQGLALHFAGGLTIGQNITTRALGGTLSFDGAGQTLTHHGTIEAAAGRTVVADVEAFVSHGTVTLNNSSTLLLDADSVTLRGTLDLRGGTLRTGGTGVNNTPGSLVTADGLIDLDEVGTFTVGGALRSPALPNRRLVVLGGIALQDTAQTELTFNNGRPDTLAFLEATGEAEIDGRLTLDSEALAQVTPGLTQTLVLAAGGLTGTFMEVAGLQIDPTYRWHLDYQADRLVAEARLSGDITGDGWVGIEDLDVLLANWGAQVRAGDTAAGDWTGDGAVGQQDLDIVLAGWGSTAPTEPNVPEPGSAALLAGLIAMLSHRRRRAWPTLVVSPRERRLTTLPPAASPLRS